jgi:hypothetical protein
LIVKWNGKCFDNKKRNAPCIKVHVVVKSNVKAVVEKHIHELATMMVTIYLNDKDGNPIGNGRKIQSIE